MVLTPRRWRQVLQMQASCKFLEGDGGKQARSPGRARNKPLKPLRREGRVFRWTCGDYLVCYLHFAHEAAGAAGTRLSLRPLLSESGKFKAKLAHTGGEIAKLCLQVTFAV